MNLSTFARIIYQRLEEIYLETYWKYKAVNVLEEEGVPGAGARPAVRQKAAVRSPVWPIISKVVSKPTYSTTGFVVLPPLLRYLSLRHSWISWGECSECQRWGHKNYREWPGRIHSVWLE